MSVKCLFALCFVMAVLRVEVGGYFMYSEAKNMTLLAFTTYCGATGVNEDWDCFWCKKMPQFQFVDSWNNPDTNTFGYVGILGNDIVIAWRGTVITDITNWANNFKFIPVPYMNNNTMKVHTGFLKSYLGVYPQFKNAVRKAQSICPTCQVKVTGHSLGGALAVLSAMDVSDILNISSSDIRLITLGMPRVGNSNFADYVSTKVSESWRLVNQRDIVPHVPPKFLGFRHPGTEVWVQESGNYLICDGSGEDPHCSNSKSPFFTAFDHLAILGIDSVDGKRYGCFADTNNPDNMDNLILVNDHLDY
eukprot:TRINITY_DN539_c0_g2_i1.p1 TRINITY_DN539_c0_g2~~TRINITY_DN539_c0_g2_i1.p1  ORF type:complete len:305 (-),score=61.74 TRINITY_DN539_c0_g2_i1:45-959(-)